jgi:hypothetical protein
VFPHLVPLFAAAKATPGLRQLFPYTAHDALFFSRCTGEPRSGGCPYAQPVLDLMRQTALKSYLDAGLLDLDSNFKRKIQEHLQHLLAEFGLEARQQGDHYELLRIATQEIVGIGDGTVIKNLVMQQPQRYRVFAADGKELGSGVAPAAAALLAQALPPNCGPAIAGTRHDFE